MNVTVKGLHVELGDAFGTRIESAVAALAEKYFSGHGDATVTITKEKNHRYTALISIRLSRGDVLEATAQNEEIHQAFDAAVEKLTTRLRRYKDKLRDHHRKEDAPELHAVAYTTFDAEAEAEGGDEPAVIAEMEISLQTLAVADAVMQLELRDLPALMFRNPATGGYNMVYRRKDGHIGWVDPEGLSARKGKEGGKRVSA